MTDKKITLTIRGTDFDFVVTTLSYNSYMNEISSQNKIAPSKQFINRSVTAECKEELQKFLAENPGAVLQITSKLLDNFAPDLEIEIKN